MGDLYLDLALRWIHILAAAILVGGTFFLRFAMGTSWASASAGDRSNQLALWRTGWARLVMMTSGLLLLTGLFNAVRNIIRYEFDVPYHGLVAVKLLLALPVFWISAVIAGRSGTAERFREKLLFWLNVNILLSLLMIGVAGYMRFAQRTPKPADDGAPAVSQVESQVR